MFSFNELFIKNYIGESIIFFQLNYFFYLLAVIKLKNNFKNLMTNTTIISSNLGIFDFNNLIRLLGKFISIENSTLLLIEKFLIQNSLINGLNNFIKTYFLQIYSLSIPCFDRK